MKKTRYALILSLLSFVVSAPLYANDAEPAVADEALAVEVDIDSAVDAAELAAEGVVCAENPDPAECVELPEEDATSEDEAVEGEDEGATLAVEEMPEDDAELEEGETNDEVEASNS